MNTILQELASRWRSMYLELDQGRDVPPAQGLRAEGMMEAAVLCGAASAVQLDELLATCYRECTGRSLSDDLGEGWREFQPFPQLPLRMRRAPVYPSTPD